jgi:hypothetical protein
MGDVVSHMNREFEFIASNSRMHKVSDKKEDANDRIKSTDI